MDAVDRIVGGLEKRSKIRDRGRARVDRHTHEAEGHATVSWHLICQSADQSNHCCRAAGALGAAWYLPEERQITPEQALLGRFVITWWSCSCSLFLGCVSTGALNDLERASKQAYAIVAYYGMSRSFSKCKLL